LSSSSLVAILLNLLGKKGNIEANKNRSRTKTLIYCPKVLVFCPKEN